MKRVPDTLTAECSEKYLVSIRLRPDGLSFSGYAPEGMSGDSVFSETFCYGEEEREIEALKNIVFGHPFFLYVYASLQVSYVGGKYTLTPDDVYLEREKARLYGFCHPDGGQTKVLSQRIESLHSVLLFGFDRKMYEFLARSLVNPQFVHPLGEKLAEWQKNSRTLRAKQLYVVINGRTIDIACFECGEMTFLNSFDYGTDNEIIYYTALVCKQLDFDQLDDTLYLSGERVRRLSVLPVLRKYVDRIAEIDETDGMDAITRERCGL